MCRWAVVLIHGIGEQRPMSTLREFVTALCGTKFSSKPDRMSESFELRRLTTPRDNPPPGTAQVDFFEYYWAYRLRDTRYKHVIAWIWRLMKASRNDKNPIPDRLRFSVRLAMAFFGFAATLVLSLVVWALAGGTPSIKGATEIASALSAVLTVFSGLLAGPVLLRFGDAARYLNAAPENVAERHAIRNDALRLLRRLHCDKAADGSFTYDRIVVVGHSLGSVIGYDALKFYWAEVHQCIPAARAQSAEALERIEPSQEIEFDGTAYRENQAKLFHFLCAGSAWRVSDFVTLGSPLTYADFLLAEGHDDFKLRVAQRELPACPPEPDERDRLYSFPTDQGRVLHHAALFAVTKWTNLFFVGDFVGGPVGVLFGDGVADREVTIPGSDLGDSVKSHTHYWEPVIDGPSSPVHELKSVIFGSEAEIVVEPNPAPNTGAPQAARR